jgi:hypothetical protein
MRTGVAGHPANPLPQKRDEFPPLHSAPRVGAEEAPEDYQFSARILATMAAMVLETVIGDIRIGI